MNKFDVYYRAFKNYRKETKNYNECKKERKDLGESNLELDVLNSKKFICSIEDDWIIQIEEGLEFVEKAVAEERQFIRTQSEVIPIEKVKKVSKDSVVDLAKHSNYITHIPENPEDDVIPDKLNIIEKLSDYAVYENRFLYMMLCFLRDFIFLRLDKIESIRRSYEGNMSFSKIINTKHRSVEFSCSVHENRDDNPFVIKDEKTDQLIVRIKNCQEIVNGLLKTNLMNEVSKSPMIKPPIVKTNVLKMNNNFKRALALYEYISSYKGLGYSVEEVNKDYSPYKDSVKDELMDATALMTFLQYKVGNDIEGMLETQYQDEEKRRKEEEEKKLRETIERMKKKARENNQTMEEYMLALEKHNNMLLKYSEELVRTKNEIVLLNKKIDELNLEKEELKRKIDELYGVIDEKLKEIAYLNQKYIDDMARLKKEHEEEIKRLNEEHLQEIEELEAKHQQELDDQANGFYAQMDDLKNHYEDKIDALNDEFEEQKEELIQKYKDEFALKEEKYLAEREKIISSYDSQIEHLNSSQTQKIEEYNVRLDTLNAKIKEYEDQRDAFIDSYEEKFNELQDKCEKECFAQSSEAKKHRDRNEILEKENLMFRAELNGYRAKAGHLQPCDDYTSRERFLELEEEFKAFSDYFEKQWKYTKKQIKKEILNKK